MRRHDCTQLNTVFPNFASPTFLPSFCQVYRYILIPTVVLVHCKRKFFMVSYRLGANLPPQSSSFLVQRNLSGLKTTIGISTDTTSNDIN